MATARPITHHDTIHHRAEERQGQPAAVKATAAKDDPGILRVDFPGGAEESLEHITWEQWFEKFEKAKLAALLQEETTAGRTSRFIKLVSRSG